MSDCWQILGIKPTNDAAAIKRAYRDRVKLYHPDTVASPEKKRRYTVICADINAAYRDALCLVDAAATPPIADEEPLAGAPEAQESDAATGQAVFPPQGDEQNPLLRFFKSRSALRTLLFLFLGFELLIFFTGPVRDVPVTVQTMAGIFVALFVGFVVYGLLVAGTIDVLIVWLFPRRLLAQLGLARYESKLVWLTILGVNVFVFFFSNLISRLSHRQISATLIDLTVRGAAAGTIPTFALLQWARDLIRYRRVKQHTEALAYIVTDITSERL